MHCGYLTNEYVTHSSSMHDRRVVLGPWSHPVKLEIHGQKRTRAYVIIQMQNYFLNPKVPAPMLILIVSKTPQFELDSEAALTH